MSTLPSDLPVPEDDGACAHVSGARLPALALPSTAGRQVDLSRFAGIVVVYCYPMTSRPGVPLPESWDGIPGARGCTPQACSFRDHHREIQHLGADLFGVSTQTTDYQREAAERLRLPFELLSDAELKFSSALKLPTFQADGMMLIKRLTLVARDGVVEKVFYPVFPPARNVDDVITWLRYDRYAILGG